MNNTYKKLCYRLLGKYIEGSSLENEFSLTLRQAEINTRGSMFLSVLLVSSLLIGLVIEIILYLLPIKIFNPISAAFLVFAASSGVSYFQLTSKIQNRRLD